MNAKEIANQLLSLQTSKEASIAKPSLLPYLLIVVAIVVLIVICTRVVSYLAKLRSKVSEREPFKN